MNRPDAKTKNFCTEIIASYIIHQIIIIKTITKNTHLERNYQILPPIQNLTNNKNKNNNMSISEQSFSSTLSSNSNNSNNILHTRIGNNKQKINKDWFDSNSDSKNHTTTKI